MGYICGHCGWGGVAPDAVWCVRCGKPDPAEYFEEPKPEPRPRYVPPPTREVVLPEPPRGMHWLLYYLLIFILAVIAAYVAAFIIFVLLHHVVGTSYRLADGVGAFTLFATFGLTLYVGHRLRRK